MNLFKYRNSELSTFVKGIWFSYGMLTFWIDYVTDTTGDDYLRKEFWYHLSGKYFSWYVDSFSSQEYHDMFYHLYTEPQVDS